MMLAPAVIRVLERRERKVRVEVTLLARAIAKSQESLAAVDETLAAVERRARENASSRYSKGSRSVAELLELEQNSQSLRASRAELEDLRERSRQALERLVDQQRALIAKWRKEEARLAHVSDLTRRERIRIDVRQFDADDEAFTERYATGHRS
jgi:outer membrane protein TolC